VGKASPAAIYSMECSVRVKEEGEDEEGPWES